MADPDAAFRSPNWRTPAREYAAGASESAGKMRVMPQKIARNLADAVEQPFEQPLPIARRARPAQRRAHNRRRTAAR
jgi:hypothetical protein